jgi:predicted neutral ceramidase superfamily lipid hydrolase
MQSAHHLLQPAIFDGINQQYMPPTNLSIAAKRGRTTTLSLFASVVLISLYVLVVYHLAVRPIQVSKVVAQLIRLVLTIYLLYQVYKGKRWAVTITTVLFTLAAFVGLLPLTTPGPLETKIPLLAMVFIYGFGVYHFTLSKNFKAYIEAMSM